MQARDFALQAFKADMQADAEDNGPPRSNQEFVALREETRARALQQYRELIFDLGDSSTANHMFAVSDDDDDDVDDDDDDDDDDDGVYMH